MSEMPAVMKTVIVEREFAHAPEKVWRALTQPYLISEWLMKNDFVPVVGHCFNLQGEWGGVVDCEVLIVEQLETLSYRCNLKHDDPAFDLRSVVTFSISPTATGTHLRMEQSGFRPDQRQAFGGARAGWPQFLTKLEQVLAQLT